MSFRRSKFQMTIEVLSEIANEEQRPTRLMYACNLSWNSIKDTLDLLTAKGYIDEMYEERRKRYYITAKGRDVLRYYAGLQDLIQVKSLSY